jgi:hypothetical protein
MVGGLVAVTLASNAAPASNLLALSAIHSSSVRAGLAFSGEADPLGRTGGTRRPQRVGR